MTELFRASAQRGTVAPYGQKQIPGGLSRGGQASKITLPYLALDVRRGRTRPRSMTYRPTSAQAI